MRATKCTPLVLLTALAAYYASSRVFQADDAIDSTLPVPVAKPHVIPAVKTIEVPKITELTTEETQAFERMEKFLMKYTGNGKFNYGTMDRMIEGLYQDKQGIKDGANAFYEKMMANRYSKLNLSDTGSLSTSETLVLNSVRASVRSQATAEMTGDFETHRVDPKTGDVPDDATVTSFVTRAELLQFRADHAVVKDLLNRAFATEPKQEVIFPEGINAGAARHILNFNPGLPPGAEIVSKSPM